MLQKIKFTVFSPILFLPLAAFALISMGAARMYACGGEGGYPGLLSIPDYALKRAALTEKIDAMEWRLIFPGLSATGSNFLHIGSLAQGFIAVYKDNLGAYPMVLFDENGQRQSLVVRSPFLPEQRLSSGEETFLAWGAVGGRIDFPIAYLYDHKLKFIRTIPYIGRSSDSIFTKITYTKMYVLHHFDRKNIAYLTAINEAGTVLWSIECEKLCGKEKLLGAGILTTTSKALFFLGKSKRGLVLLKLNQAGKLIQSTVIPDTKNVYKTSAEQTFFALNDDTLIIIADKSNNDEETIYFITVNTKTFKSKRYELPDLKDSYIYSVRKSGDKEITLVADDGIRIIDDKFKIKYILNRDVNARNSIEDALPLPSGDFIIGGTYHEDSFHPKAFVGRVNRSAFTPVP